MPGFFVCYLASESQCPPQAAQRQCFDDPTTRYKLTCHLAIALVGHLPICERQEVPGCINEGVLLPLSPGCLNAAHVVRTNNGEASHIPPLTPFRLPPIIPVAQVDSLVQIVFAIHSCRPAATSHTYSCRNRELRRLRQTCRISITRSNVFTGVNGSLWCDTASMQRAAAATSPSSRHCRLWV